MRGIRFPSGSSPPLRPGPGVARALLKFWVAAFAGMTMTGCSGLPADAGERRHPAIVSFNPCSDAILAEVADPDQVLAISHFSQDPSATSMDLATARRFRAVSGSAEEVLALMPDLVIADEYVPVATRAALNDRGIRLVQLPIVTDVDEARRQVMQIARLAGQPQRGQELIARIDTALARAAPRTGSQPASAVIWQSGGIVPGRNTLISDLLHRTGFVHFSASRGMRQAEYLSLEAILADPPQVIFAAGNRGANEDRMLSHPALDRLTATRRESFDRSLLWCGGPTIVRAAERLARVRESL